MEFHFRLSGRAIEAVSVLVALAVLAIVTIAAAEDSGPENTYALPKPTEERKAMWKKMVGTWHGTKHLSAGGTYDWVVRRDIYGRYRLEGREVAADGKIEDFVEVGEWGISGGIYFTIFKGWVKDGTFKPNDQSNPYYRDAYQIIDHTDDSITYRHIDSGREYKTQRVTDDFELHQDQPESHEPISDLILI